MDQREIDALSDDLKGLALLRPGTGYTIAPGDGAPDGVRLVGQIPVTIPYSRVERDVNGKPFNPNRKLIGWNGSSWTGFDTPDFKLDEDPAKGMGPFIMQPEGVARFFARQNLVEGPFPEHYEPFENPLGYNLLNNKAPNAVSNPAARVFKPDWEQFGKPDAYRVAYVEKQATPFDQLFGRFMQGRAATALFAHSDAARALFADLLPARAQDELRFVREAMAPGAGLPVKALAYCFCGM